MPFGPIPAVIVDALHDSQRLESPLVEGNTAVDIRDGYEDVVELKCTSSFAA